MCMSIKLAFFLVILLCIMVKSIGMKRFKVSVDDKACVGCGLCVRICPAHNLELKDGKANVGNHCAFFISVGLCNGNRTNRNLQVEKMYSEQDLRHAKELRERKIV